MADHDTGGAIRLDASFARALPELAAPWQARPAEEPRLLALNEQLAAELGGDAAWLRSDPGVQFLLGAELPEGATPVAQVYAGHQFGSYNPRLGDGRALLLGELTDAAGAVRDMHLKGSGPTPFARADGYATVGPMLREYLMGEAMHALGVPTTRAFAVVATGRRIAREEAPGLLPAAVLVRIASSHLRVGSFQYARALRAGGGAGANSGVTGATSGANGPGDGNDVREHRDPLRRLADFAMARHWPEARSAAVPSLALLESVIAAQAHLIASWMLIGFVHGVMNTDNMTISGETIDYGPCAFIDAYDPGAVFSSIDRGGRYAYGRQPAIGLWNLTRLAEAMLPLLADELGGDIEAAKAAATEALNTYAGQYDAAWVAGMSAKLGLGTADGGSADAATHHRVATSEAGGGSRPPADVVARIAAGLQHDMHSFGADYTLTFRALANAARGHPAELRGWLGRGAELGEWYAEWLALGPDADAMDAVNPAVIARNHLVDEALAAASDGDLAPFERMLDAVRRPFEVRAGFERYTQPPAPEIGPHVTYCGT